MTELGGTRIPFCVQWRGKLPEGKTSRSSCCWARHSSDSVGGCRVDIKPKWKLDGVNLLPYLTGKNTEQPHQTLLLAAVGNQWAADTTIGS